MIVLCNSSELWHGNGAWAQPLPTGYPGGPEFTENADACPLMLPMPLHLTGWRHVFYFKPHTLDLFWLHFVTIVPSMFFASCGQLIHFLPLWWAFQNYKIPSLWLLTTFIMFVKVIPSLQLIIGCRHCKEHEHRNVMCDVTDVTDAKMHQTLWSLAVQVLKKSEQFPRQVP